MKRVEKTYVMLDYTKNKYVNNNKDNIISQYMNIHNGSGYRELTKLFTLLLGLFIAACYVYKKELNNFY